MNEVKVCFFTNSYREKPPFGTNYRPHFVVKGTTEYLGIQFNNLDEAPFGREIFSDVTLLDVHTNWNLSKQLIRLFLIEMRCSII